MNGTIKLWDITSQQEFTKFEEPEMDAVNCLSFSENGFYLVSCGFEDSVVRLWDIRKNKVVKKLDLAEGKFVSKVQFDHSGLYLTLAGHSLGVCNIKSMETVEKFEGHKNLVTSVKFGNERDSYFISTSLDGDVKIHSA